MLACDGILLTGSIHTASKLKTRRGTSPAAMIAACIERPVSASEQEAGVNSGDGRASLTDASACIWRLARMECAIYDTCAMPLTSGRPSART